MADKDKAPKQSDFDKAFENMKAGKTMPTENDMGPMKDTKKGVVEGLKGYSPSKEVKKFDDNYKKGGKVGSASKRADGCCVKGKTKGRMV
jgi:hypothetical protein